MKKIICMLLAVITVLSMAACGNQMEMPKPEKNPASMPEQVQIQETTTQPATEPEMNEESKTEKYLGTWNNMANGATSLAYTFTIHADGTLTGSGYIFEEGVCYTWKESNTYNMDENAIVLTVRKGNDYDSFELCSIKLVLSEDNTYIAQIKRGMGATVYFFRPCDYEVIELTMENMMDYLVMEQYFSYDVNEFGYTKRIYNNVDVRFKEGVGRPSYCLAEFVFNMVTKEVTFEDKPSGYTVGNTQYTEEGKPTLWGGSTPCVTGDQSYGFYFTEMWDMLNKNLGGETRTFDMTFYELIGAEAVVGKIYIPVAK